MKTKFKLTDSLGVNYRPKSIQDLIGNSEIKDIINGYFSSRKIIKTWLLHGDSGCGKTSLARIIARTVNCQNLTEDNKPCGKCDSCKCSVDSHPDITEINGTAYGSVENSRNLISSARFSPLYNFKVFILDEIQGLTNQAKESLLKPIEEPPTRTIWILCTTDPFSLSPAIRGRCISFNLKHPSIKELKKFLYRVSKKEFDENTVTLLKPHLEYIVQQCNSQSRESLSVMSKLAAALTITENRSEDKIIKIINQQIGISPEMDEQVITFILNLLQFKTRTPLLMVGDISPSNIDQFLHRLHDYSYFITLYLKSKKEEKPIGRNFNNINKTKVITSLEKAGKFKEENTLYLCSLINEAFSRSRTASVPSQPILTKLIHDFVKNSFIKDGNKIL